MAAINITKTMSEVYICGATDSVTTRQDLNIDGPGVKVLTDCCHCLIPRHEARFRKQIAFDGWVMTQEVACKPGFGCDANPRKRIGKWNRPRPEYEE